MPVSSIKGNQCLMTTMLQFVQLFITFVDFLFYSLNENPCASTMMYMTEAKARPVLVQADYRFRVVLFLKTT